MGTRSKGVTVDGHTFWRAESADDVVELTTATEIELNAERTRWTVAPPSARRSEEPIETDSRDVHWFMTNVLRAMQRAAHRSSVRPAPKPTSAPSTALPADAPVACPLCLGEAWPDCELCNGSGSLSAEAASEWSKLLG